MAAIFKVFSNTIFFNANIHILIQFPVKFITRGPNNNKETWVQVIAWCWIDKKPLF